MNIIVLQHDYKPVLLSRPKEIIEVPVLDIRVVEGIEAIVVDEEVFVAPMIEEEEYVAVLVDEEEPIADVVDEEEITGTLTEEEVIIGILECKP